MSHTSTSTNTYTTTDIEIVIRRVTSDLMMIAQSSGAISEAKARDYAHDFELLAKNGYLRLVDLTLMSGQTEIKAVQFSVNASTGNLTMSRPGGVLWPRVYDPSLQVTVGYTGSYTLEARQALASRMRITWVSATADLTHSTLSSSGGRDYTSNGWSMQRKDFS